MVRKAKAQRLHFRTRMRQRGGYEVSESTRKAIIQEIQARGSNVTFIEKQSNRVTHWRIDNITRIPMVVVYDKMRKELITAWEAIDESDNTRT